MVNHPSHYNNGKKECIIVMEEKWGKLATIAFCVLNAFKYAYRAGFKEGNSLEQDHAKANWYYNYSNMLYYELPFIGKIICKILKLK